MKILNIAPGRRAAGFFRFCVCMFIALTLAAGGLALNPSPVKAIGITADPAATITVSECQPFSIQFSATGTACTPPPDPYFWFWPALPSYVTLDPYTGLLTGCPKVGDTSAVFVVGVSEFTPPACGPNTNAILVSINVVPGPAACDMVINPTFYPVAWEGMPFFMPLSVTGGVGPYYWSAAGLPPGLAVTDEVNGVISGTPGPGTCGIYDVTATVADNGTCCCPPVSRPFVLVVDCWANYPPYYFFPSACDFSVSIGPGLAYGQTNVTIDGSWETALSGNGAETFTSVPCESRQVLVDQTVLGPDAGTRYAVKGPYYKTVTDADNLAYFDYAQEVYIETGSQPSGIAYPPGAGFYAVGGSFSSTAPLAITSGDTKYVFRSWSLPGGSANPNRDMSFTVSTPGTAMADYDTYYLLTLKSDSPPVNESSWELKDSTASYNLALQPVPMPNLWGLIGGVNRPVNASGSHVMTAPYTQAINWAQDYTVPIVIILVIVLFIVGLACLLIVLLMRKKPEAAPVSAAAAPAAGKVTPAKTDTSGTANFCPKCGAPVDKDAAFCKKCGNKL